MRLPFGQNRRFLYREIASYLSCTWKNWRMGSEARYGYPGHGEDCKRLSLCSHDGAVTSSRATKTSDSVLY